MSITYSIDEDLGMVFVLWDGTVTAAEWLTHVRRLTADARWPTSRALSDLRSARLDSSIDDAVLREAAGLFGSHHQIDRLKTAIVAGDAYEQARVFEDVIARHRALVIAFNSLKPACDWLGIDVAAADEALASLRRSPQDSG